MIKPFPQNIYRVIFTTEVGIKLFDFEISKDSFTVHYCLDKLNKKPVLKILEKDFRTLLLSGSEGINANISENNYEKKFWWKKDDEIFEYKQNSNTLEISTIKIYSPKEKPKMHASLENYNKGFPQTIKIIHDNIKLSIELNFIER